MPEPATSTPVTPVRFDRALVRKYDRPGPRYTSYPTAPHFRDDFTADDHARLLAAGRESKRPLSLYVHVPFCRTRCLFCGCNVTIARDPERASRYLPLLDREMARVAALAGGERPVVQIHWGGGTPSFVSPSEVRELMATIRRRFRVTDGCEIGVEIDPRRTSDEHLDALAESGVRRLSLGVQDLDPRVQRAVRRVQPAETVERVIEGARRRGAESVNVDLIYGLPHQTPESFAATLDAVVAMAPDRVALFNFAYLPATFPHQRALDAAALPDADCKLTLLELSIERLTEAGWVFIGMDHFARPGDPLAKAFADGTLRRNFQGYTTGGDSDLLAFGASSISATGDGFAQNLRGVEDYTRAIVDGGLATARGLWTTTEDRLRGAVIQRLMARFRLDKREFEARWDVDFDRRFAAELEALEPLAADGLVELEEESIEVTPLGRLLVRNVAMPFDAHLGKTAVEYSRTV